MELRSRLGGGASGGRKNMNGVKEEGETSLDAQHLSLTIISLEYTPSHGRASGTEPHEANLP